MPTTSGLELLVATGHERSSVPAKTQIGEILTQDRSERCRYGLGKNLVETLERFPIKIKYIASTHASTPEINDIRIRHVA